MRFRMLIVPVLLLAFALPAQARAATVHGVVIAKQPQRGVLVLARTNGLGLTIHGGLAHAVVGDRVTVAAVRLRDGSFRVANLHVSTRLRSAIVRGTVLRDLARTTLVSTGRSMIVIHHRAGRAPASASDRGGLHSGEIADFRVRFDDDDLVEEAPPAPIAQAGTVQIEGTVVSPAPLVVSVEGLPVTITVPAGMTLPTSLVAGSRIELTVRVGSANTFTLVTIDQNENANENENVQQQEVEVKGTVVTSTTSQLVVNAGGVTFTFTPAAGTTLPTVPVGAFVEARGFRAAGSATITLQRVRLEDNESGDGDGGGGSGGGDDGGH